MCNEFKFEAYNNKIWKREIIVFLFFFLFLNEEELKKNTKLCIPNLRHIKYHNHYQPKYAYNSFIAHTQTVFLYYYVKYFWLDLIIYIKLLMAIMF